MTKSKTFTIKKIEKIIKALPKTRVDVSSNSWGNVIVQEEYLINPKHLLDELKGTFK